LLKSTEEVQLVVMTLTGISSYLATFKTVTSKMSTCKDVLTRFGFCQQFGFIVPQPLDMLDDYFNPWVKLVKDLENIRKDLTRSIQEEVREIWLTIFVLFTNMTAIFNLAQTKFKVRLTHVVGTMHIYVAYKWSLNP
jgi:hypothetical protein